MAISGKSFEDIKESDLLDQIQAGVPEGVLVDYKRDTYGRADGDVKEFLKDVSSFANTSGGHLFIGIQETAGVPTEIKALSGNPDEELQRLENLARSGLEPPIAGLRMKTVSISTGGFVLVARIPKSWNPPHRVNAKNTNRIYGRNSAGAYEFSIDELRVVFTSAATALDRIRAFRFERLTKIEAGEAIVPLVTNNGRVVMHLVPSSAFGTSYQIDLNTAYEKNELLRPMASSGWSPTINFDGFCNPSFVDDGQASTYTHIFRNGAIEAVKVRAFSDRGFIPTLALDQYVLGCLPNYLSCLQALDVPPPIVFMLTLQGIRGARLGIGDREWDPPPPIDRDSLQLPEVIIEHFGTSIDYQQAVRPAFDALWNAGGFTRSRHFDASGKWIGAGK